MTEAPERIWAESVGGKWRNGSWAAKPSPQHFPDEREYVLASVADRDRRERDRLASVIREHLSDPESNALIEAISEIEGGEG